MKLPSILIVLLFAALFAIADEPVPQEQVRPPQCEIGICIVADETGPELQKLGLRSVEAEDLGNAVQAALRAGKSVRVSFVVVDEDGRDGRIEQVVATSFVAPQIELPERPNYRKMSGSLQDQRNAQARYHVALRASMQRLEAEFRKEEAKAQKLVTDALEIQTKTLEKFVKETYKRRGRDYPHSDIVGAIQLAVNSLEGCKKRFVILNSDCRDRVEYRANRTTPLDVRELPAEVVLVFSAHAGGPEEESLFKGRTNVILKAEGVREALKKSFEAALQAPQKE